MFNTSESSSVIDKAGKELLDKMQEAVRMQDLPLVIL